MCNFWKLEKRAKKWKKNGIWGVKIIFFIVLTFQIPQLWTVILSKLQGISQEEEENLKGKLSYLITFY